MFRSLKPAFTMTLKFWNWKWPKKFKLFVVSLVIFVPSARNTCSTKDGLDKHVAFRQPLLSSLHSASSCFCLGFCAFWNGTISVYICSRDSSLGGTFLISQERIIDRNIVTTYNEIQHNWHKTTHAVWKVFLNFYSTIVKSINYINLL